MKWRTFAYTTTLLVTFSLGQQAVAADLGGYAGVNLNIRSGPGVRFPPVGVAGAGSELIIHGCVERYTWCDVSASGVRGWASGAHLQFVHEARRVYVPAYAVQVDIPILTFDLTSYWGEYYRDRDFYSEYDRWSAYQWQDETPPGWRDRWDDYYDTHEYR